MIIFLELLLPAISSDLPKAGGPRQRFCSVLLRMGFTCAPTVTSEAVVSYTALPPLPDCSGGSFLLHFPWSHLHRTLSGILPCEARTFLTCGLSTKLWKPQLLPGIPGTCSRDHLSYLFFIIYYNFRLPAADLSLSAAAWLIAYAQLYHKILHMKTTSANKFSKNRILTNTVTRHRKKVV